MAKDLTTSAIERQNVLNNSLAIPRIQEALDVEAYFFEGKYYLTKQMVADFYEVDVRTIDNYLSSYEGELKHDGYFLCQGKKLKNFKLQFAPENNFVSKITQLGLFDFHAFPNIGTYVCRTSAARPHDARGGAAAEREHAVAVPPPRPHPIQQRRGGDASADGC